MLLGRWYFNLEFNNQRREAWKLPAGVLFGSGGVIGVLGWSALLRFSGVEYLVAKCSALLVCLVLTAPLLFNRRSIRNTCGTVCSLRPLDKMLLFSILLMIILAFVHQSLVPSFAYDSLFSWNWSAAELLGLSSERSAQYLTAYDHKHPITIILVSFWGGWSSASFGGVSPGLTWLLCAISMACITASFIKSQTQDITRALLGALVVLTIPLVEDHYILYGYADLWVAVMAFSSVAIIALAFQHRDRVVFIVGLLLAGLCAVIKQAGVGYSVCIWLAALIAVGRDGLIQVVLGSIIIGVIFISILLIFGSLDLGFFKISVERSPLTVSASIFDWEMSLASSRDVVVNQLYALLINSSFSVLFVALLVYIFFYVTDAIATRSISRGEHHFYEPEASSLMLLSVFFILIMLTASQILIPYGFEHARPDNDVSNSRFMMPVFIPVAALLLGPWKIRTSVPSKEIF